MSISGLKDVDREILKHLDDDELLKICTINRKTWNDVCDDNFLRRRVVMKYPGIEKYKNEGESWKQFFLRTIYYISKLNEEYQFVYSYGDFKKQYELFKKHRSQDLLLIYSAKKGELPLVIHALKNGADLHVRQDLAVRLAALKGNLEIVKYLTEQGADIHSVRNIAMRWAAESGYLNVVKYIVEKGADLQAKNKGLKFASLFGHLNIVKYLVESGADVHANNGAAIKWARKNRHTDVVNYLLDK